MGQNIGYLTAKRTCLSDERYTPAYAVTPVIEFLQQKEYQTIWCPFDTEQSQFNQVLTDAGFEVIVTHINHGQNFLKVKPPTQYDVIVSNPPYSIKDKIIAKCYDLNKPFMLLMPLPVLQGKFRFQYFSRGIELLVFDDRISYISDDDSFLERKSNSFASIYFCRNVLPTSIVFRKLGQTKNNTKTTEQSVCDK